jgi:hypothetical protein
MASGPVSGSITPIFKGTGLPLQAELPIRRPVMAVKAISSKTVRITRAKAVFFNADIILPSYKKPWLKANGGLNENYLL